MYVSVLVFVSYEIVSNIAIAWSNHYLGILCSKGKGNP